MGEAEVPSGRRPQSKEPLFPRRDVCCTRQQTGDFCAAPFLRFRQCGSCRRSREGWTHALRPAHHGGEEGGELRQQRLRSRSARGGTEKAMHRKLCGEAHWGATYARGRKCENALELRGRAPAEFPGQAMHGALRAAGAREVGLCPDEIEHTGQQETALWARWGAHRERVDADA